MESDQLTEQGVQAFQLRRFEQACQIFNRAILCQPDNFEAHKVKAMSLVMLDRIDQAIDSYKLSLKYEPAQYQSNFNLALIYMRRDNFQLAAQHFRNALELKKTPNAHSELAYCMLKMDRLQEAEKEANKIQVKQANTARIFFVLGMIHLALKKDRQAVLHFQKSLQLKPSYFQSRIQLANYYELIGNLQKFNQLLKQGYQIEPDSPEVLLNLGYSYEKLQNFKEAIKCYQKALILKPNQQLKAVILTNLGHVYLQKNQLQKAQGYFKQSLKCQSNLPNTLNNMGIVLSKRKDPACIQYFQASMLKDPNFSDPINNLAIEFIQSDPNKCIQLLKSAIQKNSRMVLYKINLIGVLYKHRSRSEAFKIFEQIRPEVQDIKNGKKRVKQSRFIIRRFDQLQRIFAASSKASQQDINAILDLFNDMNSAKQGQSDKQKQLLNRLDQLQKRLHRAQQKIQAVQEQLQVLKKQLKWDLLFDQQLQSLQQKGLLGLVSFAKTIVWVLVSSVKAYRQIGLGLVQSGDKAISGKIGSFLTKVSTILSLADEVPIVGKVCSLISKAGMLYYKEQSKYIINKIMLSTQQLYSDQKLVRQVTDLARDLMLSEQVKAAVADENTSWSSQILREFQQLRNDFLQLVTNCRKSKSRLNELALQFCVQLLMHCEEGKHPFKSAVAKILNNLKQQNQFNKVKKVESEEGGCDKTCKIW